MACKFRLKAMTRIVLQWMPKTVATWRYQRGVRLLLDNLAESKASATAGAKADAPEARLASAPKSSMFVGGGAASSAAEAEGGAGVGAGALAKKGGAGEDEANYDPSDFAMSPESEAAVEELVELLLQSLVHTDTIVRWAAAKGVGRICSHLSRFYADQVLESLMDDCFSTVSDKGWHGGCLALAELARRGLLLPKNLKTVVPIVCDALVFEMGGSSSGTGSNTFTVGQHIRDAACYCVWAFARAYAPEELEVYQWKLASCLIPVACFDREINIRR